VKDEFFEIGPELAFSESGLILPVAVIVRL
jgi:hypothetical protein